MTAGKASGAGHFLVRTVCVPVSVPQGRPTIAQCLSTGQAVESVLVPEGRQSRTFLSAVPAGTGAASRGLPSTQVLGYSRASLLRDSQPAPLQREFSDNDSGDCEKVRCGRSGTLFPFILAWRSLTPHNPSGAVCADTRHHRPGRKGKVRMSKTASAKRHKKPRRKKVEIQLSGIEMKAAELCAERFNQGDVAAWCKAAVIRALELDLEDCPHFLTNDQPRKGK